MKTLLLLAALALAGPLHAQSSFSGQSKSPWASSPTPVAEGFDSIFASSPASSDPLPADQAFQTRLEVDEAGQVTVAFSSQPGYYVYLESIKISGEGVALGQWRGPEGRPVEDPVFGSTRVYDGAVSVVAPMVSASTESGQVIVGFQGCKHDSVCYPPMTRTFDVQVPAGVPLVQVASPEASLSAAQSPVAVAPVFAASQTGPVQAEDQRLASLLGDRSVPVALAMFFGLGVLLGLTPCVLPMVPIVLGLVAGARASASRTAALASVYVLAHALVFALLGLAAAWIGGGVAAIFQSAWAVVPLALVLAGLGVAMLLGVQIQMPARIQSWASQKGQGGSLTGAASLGAVSSLIIGPCVAPPLAGIVLYLAHEGNPWLGAAALFGLGLGMGVPMLAAALGFKKVLPRVGRLGSWVNMLMGAMFVGLGAWLSMRIAPQAWIVAALFAILVLLAIVTWRRRAAARESSVIRHAWVAYAALAVAVLAWPALHQPTTRAPSFDTIAAAELDAVLQRAAEHDQVVVVDLYADWCVACLEMERNTFSSPQVHQRLDQVQAVKIDITANTLADRALLKRFDLVGPPATLFFRGTQEQRRLRLVGAEEKAPFLRRLHTAQCSAPPPTPIKSPVQSGNTMTC